MDGLPPDSSPIAHAYRSSRAWGVLFVALVIGLVVDLGSKSWAFAQVADEPVRLDREELIAHPEEDPVPRHEGVTAIPRVLQLRLVINRGAVFGLGENQRQFFIVFTLIALTGGLYVFGRATTAEAHRAHLAVGLVLAGGLGNLYDRVQFGAVRDFIQMLPGYYLPNGWSWPGGNPEMFPWVFNLADLMLLAGMLSLMHHLNRQGWGRRRVR